MSNAPRIGRMSPQSRKTPAQAPELVFRVRRALLRGFAAAALALAFAGCSSTGPATGAAAQAPKNIIIMFADGTAPTQWEFGARSSRLLRGEPFATTEIVFRDGALGLLSTYPHGALVTDSAAAASAMSTGTKVVNGSVSVAPDGKPLLTLMRAAKARGKRIGLVTTATVYDATPAAFALNARSRGDYQALVDQYLALEPDVLMGGGADFFLPLGTAGGKRKDGRDVLALFRGMGYAVARDTAGLKAARGSRVLGLFADKDMDFELDRAPAAQPSTAEMAAAALDALSRDSPGGFVLLVENEGTDSAGHMNDAASLMHALWAFDDAVKVALDFQRRDPDTLVIVTGDHETGGFSPTYAMETPGNPHRTPFITNGAEHVRMIGRITMSLEAVRVKLGSRPSAAALDDLIARHFPGFTLDPDLRGQILEREFTERNFTYMPQNALARMVARRTGFYWGTSGHTPEPVAVGAIGPGAGLFRGYQDNTDFGRHLHRLVEGR